MTDGESNDRTASTTWEWRKVKMRRPPEAKSASDEVRPQSPSLLGWPRGKPMTIVIKYRGGPEAWVEVRARGRIWRRPGSTAIYDVMCEIFGWRIK